MKQVNGVRRSIGALAVCCVLASACSGSESADDVPVFTPATGGESLANPSTTLIAPEPTEPPQIERPKLADFEIPCGITTEQVEVNEDGVNDDTIAIGAGSDEGAEFAGLSGAAIPDAVLAMAEFCNAAGGLAGRVLSVSSDDAALTELESLALRQCERELALVGGGYLDRTVGDAVWDECDLPRFYAWLDEVIVPGAPSVLFDVFVATRQAALSATIDVAALEVAVLGPDTDYGIDWADKVVAAFEQDGIAASAAPPYVTKEAANWFLIADAVSSADLVYVYGSCRGAIVPLVEALQETDVAVIAGPTAYDIGCLAESEADLSSLIIDLPFLPLEDLDAAPQTGALAQVLRDFATPITGDALLASAAFWRFAQATEACVVDGLDRDCLTTQQSDLVDELGLLDAAINDDCRVVMSLGDGGFRRVAPIAPGEFLCPEPAEPAE